MFDTPVRCSSIYGIKSWLKEGSFEREKKSTLLGRWEYCPQNPLYLSYISYIINKFYLYCFHSSSEISSFHPPSPQSAP